MIEYDYQIKNDVEEVIKYSQDLDKVNIEELMANWAKNKEQFYHAFGDQYIKNLGKIEIHLSDQAKHMQFNDFVDECNFENSELATFLMSQEEGFFDNKVVQNYEYDNIIIPKGMRLLKAFKFFIHDKEELDTLQTSASVLIQNNKIVGELCLSIHPLDFLSSSENTYKWRSCHSLDGEYRAGNLSYMGDSTTIITYIKGYQDDYLPNFPDSIPWNSKKWRMLLFASESRNYLMAGRQYPMDLGTNILDKIRDAYAECMDTISEEDQYWSSWHDDQITEWNYESGDDDGELRSPAIIIRKRIYTLSDIVKDIPAATHYNDLLYSTCYVPFYCWNKYAHTKPKFEIGSSCKCVRCGREYIEAGNTSMLGYCCNDYEDDWDIDIDI